MKNIWLLIEQLFRFLSNIFIFSVVAKHYGANDIGSYSFAISISSILVVFTKFGLEQIILKKMSQGSEDINYIFSSSLLLLLTNSIIVFSLSIIAYNFIGEQSLIILYALCLIIPQPLIIAVSYYQSINKFFKISQINVAVICFASILKVVLMLSGLSIKYLVFIFIFEQTFTSLILFLSLVLNSKIKIILNYNLITSSKKMLLEAWPLLLSSLSIIVYMRTDQIMLGLMSGNDSVGHYSVASKLYEATLLFPTILTTFFSPKIYKLFETENRDKYINTIAQISGLGLIYHFVVLIVCFLFGEYVLVYLFGNGFRYSSEILNILTFSGIFAALGITRGPWVISEGIQKYSMYYIMLGAILNLLLNLYLIPTYGAEGAALSSLLSQLFVAVIAPSLFSSTRSYYSILFRVLDFNIYKGFVNAVKSYG